MRPDGEEEEVITGRLRRWRERWRSEVHRSVVVVLALTRGVFGSCEIR